MKTNELKVTLVDGTGLALNVAQGNVRYTPPKHYAAAILVFAKETRLEMSPDGFNKFLEMDYDDLVECLDYISKTIPASWEFVDFTFTVENVTRACIQQMTRTRYTPAETDLFGSYAAQSQRVTDMSQAPFLMPEALGERGKAVVEEVVNQTMEEYAWLIEQGEEPEDARSILPMNLQSNIVVKYNLRTFVDLVRSRKSLRAQSEYRKVADGMVRAVAEHYPWVHLFLRDKNATAIEIIETIAKKLPTEDMRALAKAADLIRKG